MVITSRQNPKIKTLLQLRRRREREQSGLTLIDGFEELSCALDSGVVPHEVYYCPELMGGPEQHALVRQLIDRAIPAYELSRTVFEKAAYREGPDGWLAIAPAPGTALDAIDLSPNPFLLVLEAVEKPGNIGAMLRTADAAGVDAVISVASITDFGNPNVIRASKGAVFAVPVITADPAQAIGWLAAHNIDLIASTPSTTTLYTKANLKKGVALSVGSEKFGHSDFWLGHASVKVRIPMAGKVNSLNVATSAALLMYETVRQRDI